jgi:hypothetical protein
VEEERRRLADGDRTGEAAAHPGRDGGRRLRRAGGLAAGEGSGEREDGAAVVPRRNKLWRRAVEERGANPCGCRCRSREGGTGHIIGRRVWPNPNKVF